LPAGNILVSRPAYERGLKPSLATTTAKASERVIADPLAGRYGGRRPVFRVAEKAAGAERTERAERAERTERTESAPYACILLKVWNPPPLSTWRRWGSGAVSGRVKQANSAKKLGSASGAFGSIEDLCDRALGLP